MPAPRSILLVGVALSLLMGHAHAWCIGKNNGECPRGWSTRRSLFGCAAGKGAWGYCIAPGDCTGSTLNPPFSAAETKACEDDTYAIPFIRRSLAAASTAELKLASIKVWKQLDQNGDCHVTENEVVAWFLTEDGKAAVEGLGITDPATLANLAHKVFLTVAPKNGKITVAQIDADLAAHWKCKPASG